MDIAARHSSGPRVFLLSILIAASALSVKPPAQSEAAFPIAFAACVGPQALMCAAVVAGVLAMGITYYGWRSGEIDMQAIGDATANWYMGLSDALRTSVGLQALAGRVTFTPDMLAGLTAEFGSALGTGTQAVMVYGQPDTAGDVHYRYLDPPGTTRSGAVETIVRGPTQYSLPTAWLNSNGYQYAQGRVGIPAGTAITWRLEIYRADTNVSIGTVGSYNGMDNTGGSITAYVNSANEHVILGGSAATPADIQYLAGTGWYAVYSIKSWTGTAKRYGFEVGPYWLNNDHSASPSYSTADYKYPANGMYVTTGAETLTGAGINPVPAEGITVRTPADLADLEGAGVGTPVRGIDGVTGPAVVGTAPVTPNTTTLTDNSQKGWWEGLFAGVTAAIGAVTLKLTNVTTSLSDLVASVADLPTTVSTAIQTTLEGLFVPAEGIQMRLDSQYSRWSNLPPFILGAALLAAFTAFVGLTTVSASDLCWPVMLRTVELPFCIDLDPIATPLLVAKYLLDFYVLTLLATWMVGWWRSFISGE